MTSNHEIIHRFFDAMQAGATGEAEMMGLFANDAVYAEPFGGEPARHEGKGAIRAAMAKGWKHPLPDMTITVDALEIDGDRATAEWTCRSPALPGGQGRGVNVFTVRDGLIVALETRLLP